MGQGRRHLWVPAAVLAVLSLAAAALTWAEDPTVDQRPQMSASSATTAGAATSAATPARASTRASARGPAGGPGRTASGTPETPRGDRPPATAELPGAGVPSRVLIDALGIDAPVLSVAMQAGSLDPPPDPQDLGWWGAGAQPGAARGSALIIGHTVHDGGGALDDLEQVARGTVVRVRTAGGLVRYVVDSVEVLDKETVAVQAPRLFSQEVDGRLVLVTCEDWDGTGYRSNVVVVADPVA